MQTTESLPQPAAGVPAAMATPVDDLALIARLCASALEAPIALVVETGTPVLRASHGLDPAALEAVHSMVGDSLFMDVFAYGHPLAVEDARVDSRFLESAAGRVMGLTAYCGVPVLNVEGQAVATLCVIDIQPRVWSARHLEILQDLAGVAARHFKASPPLRAVRPRSDGGKEDDGLSGFLENMPAWFTDHATVGFAALDCEGRCIWANHILEAMLRQDAGTLAGQPMAKQIPVVQTVPFENAFSELLRSRKPQSLEMHFVDNGVMDSERFLAVSLYPLEQSGALKGVGAFFTEISDRRKSERQLRLAEEKLALACEAANVGLWFWDLRTDRLEWTERCKAIFGLPPDAWVDYATFVSLLHPEDTEVVEKAVRRTLEESGDYRAVYRILLPDGNIRWVEAKGRTFVGNDGQLAHMMGAVIDISETKQKEELLQAKSDALFSLNDKLADLVDTRTEELQRLSQHLIDLAEVEKAQLARELHDELGAHLTVVQMEVAAALRRISDKNSDLAIHLARARETVLETTTIKRRIIEGLRPSLIESLGLAEAVRALVKQYEQSANIVCHMHIPSDLTELDNDLSIALYRIVQESLTNIAKYAEASEVSIRLEKTGENILLEVTDNGKGLPEDYRTRATAHGISGMQQRAARFKGVFSIMSRQDGPGTRLTTLIPLGAEKEKV